MRRLLLIATLFLAACSSAPSPTPVASQTAPSSNVSTPTPTPSVPSATASAIAGATCRTSQLRIDLGAPGFGTGNVGAWLRFRNISSVACRLHGWPKLVGVSATGDTTARETNTVMTFPSLNTAPTVSLAPGETAYAAFEGSDTPMQPSATCPPPYLTLQVTPPGDTASISLSGWNDWLGADQPACIGLAVTMIVSATDVPPDELPFVAPSSTP